MSGQQQEKTFPQAEEYGQGGMDPELVKADVGLTTEDALRRLHNEIATVLREFKESQKKSSRHTRSWLIDTVHHQSRYTSLCWTSAVALIFNSLVLLIASLLHGDISVLLEGLLVLLLVGTNFVLVARDNKFRHLEIPSRVSKMLTKLVEARNTCCWLPENYPHLCSPFSPCITLQWTYRDGHLVNLPWALLVSGDVIVMRPGQQAPALCVPFDDKQGEKLHAKEVYSPMQRPQETLSIPTARAPHPNKKYVLQETPYLNNLRLALDQALDRPVTYYNRLRHLLMITCMEHLALPVTVVSLLFVNLIRYVYLSQWVGAGDWVDMFLLQLVCVALPLLPIVFPAAWLLLDAFGMARVFTLVNASALSQKVPVDPFEEGDLEQPLHHIPEMKWTEVQHHLMDILRGEGQLLSRSANLLHVLGSVTALCCVDKKGILSWPNPTAEKVFFLRNTAQTSRSSSWTSMSGHVNPMHLSEDEEGDHDDGASRSSYTHNADTSVCGVASVTTTTVAEVLDLTHDNASPFRLQFDDQAWKKHLTSLKPLGLAVLLNTCNMATQQHYMQFCSHVTCEALYNEDLVPVTNRRCLCELAKQIGFVDQAQDIFKLEEQLSTYRHVQPELVRRDIKFARSLSMTKLKFPFPHMVAVVVREQTPRGSLQLMSQGTADIILDSCVEYWDGHDLCPLSPADRKKVQDFYQRTSLTAYCTAFAYRPLTRGVSSKLSQVYLELPADSKHLYMPHRSPTPLAWDIRNMLDPRTKGLLGHFHSTDSLLGTDAHEDDVNDVEGCFELQCNQVFIGMVTMQYQAQIDMVQLIEQLERACIRFVHFSKENELRSRVFSEKMGLESGWNCHISLLSERNRSDNEPAPASATAMDLHSSSPLPRCHTQSNEDSIGLLNARSGNIGNTKALSYSAPSAINLEFSQVKFEDEDPNNKSVLSHGESASKEQRASQDSVLVHSMDLTSVHDTWRSLSCLTDSTEQSAPVNFIMSNRAKLPRGIDKIRPHLELIDNVPLLVSLFTDCTPAVTREMLHIMQEYGEVVCVIGSSANCDNMSILLQADASLAVEPLYPQVCQKIPVFQDTNADQGPSPVELSRSLNSIACSLSFRREDPISIFHLITEDKFTGHLPTSAAVWQLPVQHVSVVSADIHEASPQKTVSRHYMQCVWNCMQFWVCSSATLSGLQLLGAFLMLPPILTTGLVLWLVCLVVPAIALSLVANARDPHVMQRATGKNQCVINSQVAVFVLWCYGTKFLPTVLMILLLYCISLSCFCHQVAMASNITCTMVYPSTGSDTEFWGGWDKHPLSLLTAQHIVLVLLVLHFVIISVGFVEREYSIWNRSPHHNQAWLTTVITILILQAFFTGVAMGSEKGEDFPDIPWHVWTLGFLSPIFVFFINELVKREEIKANVRYQKRARLEFGTKLGMNSPF